MPRPAAWAFLATLVMLSLHLRLRQSASLPRYDPEDETGYFRAESALQYRYARMIARGQGLPELDRAAQHPEGLRPRRELTSWMEYATGWSYRLAPFQVPSDFRWFVLLWTALCSSLSIPAFYLIARRLTRSPPVALAACAVYGLSWAAMADVIGTYRLESFALPLIHWSLAFLAQALDPEERRSPLYALASGLALFAALASWHFTRFYLASLVMALLYAFLRSKDNDEALKLLRQSLCGLMACALAAGLCVSSLRESRFLLSPAFALGLVLLAALFRPKRAWLAGLAVIILMATLSWISREAASYSHVYGLLWAKVRFGLIKPQNPALLSPEMRLEWTGPSNSPEPGFLLFALVPFSLMMIPRLASWFRREQSDMQASPILGDIIDALFVIYAAGTVLVSRLLPLWAFFLGLAALRLPEKTLKKSWLILGLVLLAALEGLKSFAPASRYNILMLMAAPLTGQDRRPSMSFRNESELLRWLKENGGPQKPALAPMGLSASILAYAATPVLLQPKFETPIIRAKTAEYLKALYSDEEGFFAFCGKYGAKLFVYSADDVLDETAEGPRYGSGSLRLEPGTAAVLFHFHPEKLKHFRLLYENEDFRVYAVGPAGAPDRRKTFPIYDIEEFRPRTLKDGSLSLDAKGVLERRSTSRSKLFMARILARLGRTQEALKAYEESFAAWPPEEAASQEAERLKKSLKP